MQARSTMLNLSGKHARADSLYRGLKPIYASFKTVVYESKGRVSLAASASGLQLQ
jgi:hypothetical protein